MSGYWLRVENGLLYLVRSSDMAGDEPKMATWVLQGAQDG